MFGAKPKPAGGGAGAPSVAYVPPPKVKTNFEVMIEKNGID